MKLDSIIFQPLVKVKESNGLIIEIMDINQSSSKSIHN